MKWILARQVFLCIFLGPILFHVGCLISVWHSFFGNVNLPVHYYQRLFYYIFIFLISNIFIDTLNIFIDIYYLYPWWVTELILFTSRLINLNKNRDFCQECWPMLWIFLFVFSDLISLLIVSLMIKNICSGAPGWLSW